MIDYPFLKGRSDEGGGSGSEVREISEGGNRYSGGGGGIVAMGRAVEAQVGVSADSIGGVG